MNINVLKVIIKLRGLSQSDVAKMAGISRQAVSLWFKKTSLENPQIDLHIKHLQALSQALKINIGDLLEPLPCFDNLEYLKNLKTMLLWDNLYSSIEDFVIALIRNDLRSLARFVQVFGLFETTNLIGTIVWRKFSQYKKYLHPVRRKECEELWNLQQSLGLI